MIKQVIIIRRDLKMRRGKEIAQGSHASMAFLCDLIADNYDIEEKQATISLTTTQLMWVLGTFAKVCLQTDSEAELLEIHHKAINSGLVSKLILDSGKTEFNGVPTHTAIAIGPDYSEKIDKITGHLKLY